MPTRRGLILAAWMLATLPVPIAGRASEVTGWHCPTARGAVFGPANSPHGQAPPPSAAPLDRATPQESPSTNKREHGTPASEPPDKKKTQRPVELEPSRPGRVPVDQGHPLKKVVQWRLALAGEWLARFAQDELRFDAAIGLTMIRKNVDSPALREAYRRARAVADVDDDNPLRRFWKPDHDVPRAAVAGWQVPSAGQPRINVNRVVAEACFCDRYGLRAETLAYLSGPMRDRGGYHTTHALWALVIAHDHGCIDDRKFAAISAELQKELRDAQPAGLDPATTLDIDLYGERLLMLLLSGEHHKPAGPHSGPYRGWLKRLLELQNDDGSWGIAKPDEPPYYRYHATLVATWVLSQWLRGGR